MRIVIRKGDIARASASAIVTSANDALVGNSQPLYWRFASRKNVDGAIRLAAGPGLAKACLDFPHVEVSSSVDGASRDISRWEETCKRGTSATLRCAPGHAVVTAAYALDACHLIHAVAPDSEFGYEGHYQGQPGERGVEVRAWSSPPLTALASAYTSALDRAHDLGAQTIACPSLGTGVKGWRPAISAAVGLDALARHANTPEEVHFVLGSDDALVAWRRVAALLLGTPEEEGTWLLPDGPLALSTVPELMPKPKAKHTGWAGDHWRPTNAGW